MTEKKAVQIATAYFQHQIGLEPVFIGSNKLANRPDEWNILFEKKGPSGKSFEGPIIVIVKENGEVRFFD